MIKLDKSDRVVKWGSEPIKIYYINPLDGKPHRYYPDFYVELSNGSKYILEIKPYKESITPKSNTKTGRARPRKTVLKEHLTYRKNRAKWKYAEAFCKKRGVIFQVITEKELEIML